MLLPININLMFLEHGNDRSFAITSGACFALCARAQRTPWRKMARRQRQRAGAACQAAAACISHAAPSCRRMAWRAHAAAHMAPLACGVYIRRQQCNLLSCAYLVRAFRRAASHGITTTQRNKPSRARAALCARRHLYDAGDVGDQQQHYRGGQTTP